MPEGWAWCRLNQIYNFIDYRGVTPNKIDSGVPLVTAKNVKNGYIDYSISEFISKADYEKRQGRGSPRKGDLLFTTEAPLGNCAIADLDIFSPGQRIITFQQYTNTEFLNNKLFLYFILSDKFQELIYNKRTGTTVTGIKAEKLKLIFIPLPPKKEQDSIISVIENIYLHINSIEKSKLDLQEIIKQTKSKILDLAIHGKLVPQDPKDEPAEELLNRIATSDNRPYEKVEEEPFEIPDSWKWVKLNDLAEIARGGSPRPIQDYITDNQDGINWIKIGDTSEESKYITSAKEKIKPDGKKHSRFVHAGDFLLTNSMSFGRPYILKIDGCIHDGWLVFANIKECLLQDYLYYALSSAYIYETFSNVAAGSTVKNLKSDTVKQVNFPLPPLSEQRRIVEAIEKMYEVLDKIQNNLV